MKGKVLVRLFCLVVLMIGAQLVEAKTPGDVLGLRVGMSHDEAISRLQKIAKKDHDERKQQEIWKLKDDPNFSYIIISFDKEYKSVRFVTAKVREGGKRIRYSDVIDTKKAAQLGSANNYNYVLEVPARGGTPAYKVIARGTDKDFLTYLAVEEVETVVAPKN